MILVSCGTEKYPFDRLAGIMQEYSENHSDEKIIFQSKVLHLIPSRNNIDVCELLPPEEFRKAIIDCDHYICHAGIGSIMTALFCGVIPFVIPRLQKFDEHVDDHQLQITEKMNSLNMIRVFHDLSGLEQILADRHDSSCQYVTQNQELLGDIRQTVDEWLKAY